MDGFIAKDSRYRKKKRSKFVPIDVPILNREVLSERTSKNEIGQPLMRVDNLFAFSAQIGKCLVIDNQLTCFHIIRFRAEVYLGEENLEMPSP